MKAQLRVISYQTGKQWYSIIDKGHRVKLKKKRFEQAGSDADFKWPSNSSMANEPQKYSSKTIVFSIYSLSEWNFGIVREKLNV